MSNAFAWTPIMGKSGPVELGSLLPCSLRSNMWELTDVVVRRTCWPGPVSISSVLRGFMYVWYSQSVVSSKLCDQVEWVDYGQTIYVAQPVLTFMDSDVHMFCLQSRCSRVNPEDKTLRIWNSWTKTSELVLYRRKVGLGVEVCDTWTV